ncbi:protein OBERON 1 [Daucus carota subsp. sativus]|uniref:protein OBERON 1 n=1 Tax=Daucus carota subsp. sativus TaxID=79200 RepID=UPI0007EF2BAD|nr:PREDICTED: protein OBERON 1-like [Daucus carota subsp. sativus]
MEMHKKERKGGLVDSTVNGFRLFPVSPHESGEGLPYAPADWPCPGDIWSWKVGKRIIASGGYFLDRHLFLPERLQTKPRGRGFVSKVSVEQYVREIFPGQDVKAFFELFSWRIPCKSPSDIKEDTCPESKHATISCKAGNKLCSSLTEPEKPPANNFCDICCTVPEFCRDCCCILCSKTVNPAYENHGFIRCESTVENGINCGHVAHLECGLKANMAGTVGGLDVEYYCRRCDTRTDLLPHVKKFIPICESISSLDDIKKILNLGVRVLHGSQRSAAKRLLHIFEIAMGKQYEPRLEIVPVLDNDWNVDVRSTSQQGVMICHNGNHVVQSATDEEHVDIRQGSPKKVSTDFDPEVESLKLEHKVEQTLQALKESQELEFKIAKERLQNQKNCIQNLYQQLGKEKSQIERHMAYVADPDVLLQLTESKVDQINKELHKLEDMKAVSEGFAKTSKEILKQYFGLEN